MEQFHDESDNIQTGTGSIEIAHTTPDDLQDLSLKKLDPSLMKALKLFAKNHQQLEKAQDPNRGIHRRILSQDGRSNNQNI
ncbi:UNKNOWN [Stylonychia lemnae]|uniref:Uncharacterized protein n=1 Tax=Stylonychia lemnae TaxID=5949 RepID=A0A078ALA4_STYLE|nr:UNKNOWN [Stylonychia lemnae]|eukprot:CDW82656.1 UNKNOWN [Stylonychia lemnae]